MVCDSSNINNLQLTIKSILNQDVERDFYEIILFVSKKYSKKKFRLPEYFISFLELNRIILKFLNSKINLQTRLIEAINEFPNNPILIINNNTIFPEGWLEMFLNDHNNYPNDIIAGSIQYYFNQNNEIKTFSEGYKGYSNGIFNHVTNLIFNFALVNTDLGGTLYPAKCFKFRTFYNINMFKRVSKKSDEFWQSCFIMIEGRNLRQSSKIYDYTKYIINKNSTEFINNKINLFTNLRKSFLNYFPWFKKIILKRQHKIIISLTSYSKRLEYLPILISSLKNQTFPIKTILLILYEQDRKLVQDNIDGVKIISINEDLKPHKKYYYTMRQYRNYAIITVDDDVIYCRNMIKSLYNSYIEYPNLVSGRSGHFMEYKKNRELKEYLDWFNKSKLNNYPDFNMFLTGIGGIIYPPDILNIQENYLDIINEILIGDDFTLKHYEIKKGIEARLINNSHPLGFLSINNDMDSPLFDINKINNNIYMKKINIAIENEIIKDLCVNYKNINTGNIIYLFNINNINFDNDSTNFYLDAYSYCPIDENIKFQIKFGDDIAKCDLIYPFPLIDSNNYIIKTKKIGNVFCSVNKIIKNINNIYFPKIITNNNFTIKFFHKKKYLPIIFKDLHKDNNTFSIELLFYKSIEKGLSFNLRISNYKLNCCLTENVSYLFVGVPIIKYMKCQKIHYKINNNLDVSISSLPLNKRFISKNQKINNQFIIDKIYYDYIDKNKFIIIKGRIAYNIDADIFDLKVHFLYPKISLICNLESSKTYIQTYLYCLFPMNLNDIDNINILLENQIISSESYNYNLILINSETLNQNYTTTFENNMNPFKLEVKDDNDFYYPIFLIISSIIIIVVKQIYYLF